MKKRELLISKDVFMRGFLPVYGNQYNVTPNIDELASKGTIFMKHYTAAPSTAMSFTSMFTGKYAYETDRKTYMEVGEWNGETLFDKLYKDGYACHAIWDESYTYLAQRFSKCYGKNTTIHNTTFLTRKQPAHISGKYDDMSFDPQLEEQCIRQTEALTNEILQSSDRVFLWIHFPHALLGRNAYGSDIDMLDKMVGMFRKYFDDDAIYITADHGHMNGSHGKYGYGFDVYQNAIQIPLITPRIKSMSTVDYPTSNTQLGDIIYGNFEQSKIVYSENAYYMQPHRKIAVIHNRYKYIYEKKTKREFLYDVEWDPEENVNLLDTEIYDCDRKRKYSLTQRFFYPYWESITKEYEYLKGEKDKIWRNAPWYIEQKEKALLVMKNIYRKFH